MINLPSHVPVVLNITLSNAKQGFVVQITNLSGSNVSEATVNLTRKGYSNVIASYSLITTIFNLSEIISGVWNLSFTNTKGMTGSLKNDFSVLSNISGKFFGVPRTTIKPLTVNFYEASKGNPTSWAWNFDKGASNVTTKNATHIYSTVGSYSVKLTIGDS